MHQAVVHAIESYLAAREIAGTKADADTLRALVEAREAVRAGDVVRAGRRTFQRDWRVLDEIDDPHHAVVLDIRRRATASGSR
ncbi:MAG: hypothetical protein ACRDQA_05110 [Nocardioidaceae bacterium]